MTILYVDDSGPIIWPDTDSHDINSKKFYYINYRPSTRINSTEYIKGVDVIIPSTSNGCMYECVSGGISAISEPIFDTTEGKFVVDGTVKWKCKPFLARLGSADVITISSWTGDVGVTTSSPIILNNIATGVRVDSAPSTVKKITITNHITVLRSSGRTEEFEKSIIIPIKTL
jgi:hypothetical protein